MNAPLKHTDEPAATFVRRHIGPSPRDVNAMLETVGAKSLGALMAETLPSSIRQQAPLDLGGRFGQPERLGGPDRRRHRGIHQRVDVVVPEKLDHPGDLVRTRPDVPVGEGRRKLG